MNSKQPLESPGIVRKRCCESRCERGSITILTLVFSMICCVIIIETLHVAALNTKICFWDHCSLQAEQAAQAGLAWARCQLDAIPPDDPGWMPNGTLVLGNEAQAVVSCTRLTRETATEYAIVSTGVFRGSEHRLAKSFLVSAPVPEDP